MFLLLISTSLLGCGLTAYVPGTPGSAWSREEILAVKAKIRRTFKLGGGMAREARKGILKSQKRQYYFLHDSSISLVLGIPVRVPGENGGGYNAPKVLRLAFHDCLKYEDGSGGCDGCLNWDGVGVLYDKFKQRLYPDRVATDNNGLTNAVEVLEAIYTDPAFPNRAPVLEQSLKESGKSRADLWSLAGIVAVEYGIETNNLKVVFFKLI